ncbi:protein-glutamine glutaminase family protein [Pseudoroseomonas ludipueritiae]|uniref:Protein glutaminase domain-containing protein n=1 Tax=Pseudoroseomonas ludipueritiae TaxID=198093 RepID=A0ABR7R7P7_9PROT|nr:protein-glutamine glutaminase family protein [Pseudoroseomonas ludipueritiae]MBC9177758.1 hypothetical protein [Pseudoroseomonas ludipueritiae]
MRLELTTDPRTSGVMSLATANEAFSDLLDGNLGASWNRLAGGCEYRAHAAVARLAAYTSLVFKAWALPHIGLDGTEKRPLVPQRQIPDPTAGKFHTWAFHVAPAALVLDGAGRVSTMVFDPSLLDGPCATKRWMWAMSASDGRLLLTGPEVFLIDTRSLAYSKPPGDDVVAQNLAAQGKSPDAVVARLLAEVAHGK